jgi:hypothetical protein
MRPQSIARPLPLHTAGPCVMSTKEVGNSIRNKKNTGMTNPTNSIKKD